MPQPPIPPEAPPVTPAPVPLPPADPPRFILVFGGTFDPPHRGHIDLPARVRDELERRLDCPGRGWVLYIPAARSPHKPEGPIASDADRLEMLRLALAESGTPRAAIWTDELDRAARVAPPAAPPPSFTIDTLTRLRSWLDEQALGGVDLRLLIGADQALGFHRWRQPRDILRLAKPAVMVRGDIHTTRELTNALGALGFWTEAELIIWSGSVVPAGNIDASAGQIRELLRRGDLGALGDRLPRAVREFIGERALYTAR